MKKRRNVSVSVFVADNQLLLLFLGLLLVGTAIGSAVGKGTGVSLSATAVDPSWDAMFRAWASSMLMPAMLLGALFLAGLTAFGVPIAMATPLFFGLGIGMTQGYYYAQGIHGVALSCAVVLPRFAIAAVGILMACAESFRMSVRFGRLLLPSGTIGNLWLPFRLYVARFLLFIGIAAVSAAVDVAIRVILM